MNRRFLFRLAALAGAGLAVPEPVRKWFFMGDPVAGVLGQHNGPTYGRSRWLDLSDPEMVKIWRTGLAYEVVKLDPLFKLYEGDAWSPGQRRLMLSTVNPLINSTPLTPPPTGRKMRG